MAIKGWIFGSSTSDAEYETLLYPDKTTSCNCPGWTRMVADDGSRECRHTRSVEAGHADDECDRISFDITAREEVPEAREPKRKEFGEPFEKLTKPDDDLPKEPAERVNKLFADLQSYGFVAYQGIMHTKESGEEFVKKEAGKRISAGTPVAGLVWTLRNDARAIKSGAKKFNLFFDTPDEDSVPKSSVVLWILEVLHRNGMKRMPESRISNSMLIKLED